MDKLMRCRFAEAIFSRRGRRHASTRSGRPLHRDAFKVLHNARRARLQRKQSRLASGACVNPVRLPHVGPIQARGSATIWPQH